MKAEDRYEGLKKTFLWYRKNLPNLITKIYIIKYKNFKLLWMHKLNAHLKLILKNQKVLDNYITVTGNKLIAFLFLQNMVPGINLGVKKEAIISIELSPFRGKLKMNILPSIYRKNTVISNFVEKLKDQEKNLIRLLSRQDREKVDFIRIIAEKKGDQVALRFASLIEEAPLTLELLKMFDYMFDLVKIEWKTSYLGLLPKKYMDVIEM